MYKIAVIGDRPSTAGFASLGLSTFEVSGREDAALLIKKLADHEFAVIYLTEKIAALIPDVIERYRGESSPALIPIPGVTGNTGEGLAAVHRAVEKAVGSDILSN